MKISELLVEAEHVKKAGFIPYFHDGNDVRMMFMTPSNSAFGGSSPSIAKGGIDKGETSKVAGIREAQEELGLKRSNLKAETVRLGADKNITGLDESYRIQVFIGEVKSMDDFDEPHYETGSVHWLTLSEFKSKGRKSQVPLVVEAASKIS